MCQAPETKYQPGQKRPLPSWRVLSVSRLKNAQQKAVKKGRPAEISREPRVILNFLAAH